MDTVHRGKTDVDSLSRQVGSARYCRDLEGRWKGKGVKGRRTMASDGSTFNLVAAACPSPFFFSRASSNTRRRSNGLETPLCSLLLDPLGRNKGFFHRFPPGAGLSFDRWADSGRVLAGIDGYYACSARSGTLLPRLFDRWSVFFYFWEILWHYFLTVGIKFRSLLDVDPLTRRHIIRIWVTLPSSRIIRF